MKILSQELSIHHSVFLGEQFSLLNASLLGNSSCHKEEGETVKAQVSITCVPCVLIILTVCPAERWVATPWLAGMSDGAIVMSSDF